MNHREQSAAYAAAYETESELAWRDRFRLIAKQLGWVRDKLERGAKLCKDSWDRAHMRTLFHALAPDHPLIRHIEGEINEAMSDTHVPVGAADRKALPLCTGVLDYFPDALLEVAQVSKKGNEQHNPGQPLHWAKEKSTDEPDALLRHLVDRGKRDADGQRHSAKVAWRALALLQREIEAEVKVAPPQTVNEFAIAGPGYRLLKEGELVEDADECRRIDVPTDEWDETVVGGKRKVGEAGTIGLYYRRKVTA